MMLKDLREIMRWVRHFRTVKVEGGLDFKSDWDIQIPRKLERGSDNWMERTNEDLFVAAGVNGHNSL